MTDRNDQLVAEYLGAVGAATADLPPERRDELLADLTEHIATARAELRPETEAGVRTILDRLGDPANIAAEARLGTVPAATMPPQHPVAPGRRRLGRTALILLAAVALAVVLCCAGLVASFLTTESEPLPNAPVPVPSPTISGTG